MVRHLLYSDNPLSYNLYAGKPNLHQWTDFINTSFKFPSDQNHDDVFMGGINQLQMARDVDGLGGGIIDLAGKMFSRTDCDCPDLPVFLRVDRSDLLFSKYLFRNSLVASGLAQPGPICFIADDHLLGVLFGRG